MPLLFHFTNRPSGDAKFLSAATCHQKEREGVFCTLYIGAISELSITSKVSRLAEWLRGDSERNPSPVLIERSPASILSAASGSIDSARLIMAKDRSAAFAHEIMIFSCYTGFGCVFRLDAVAY